MTSRLAFGCASGSAVTNAKNDLGVVTSGRQPVLGCKGFRLAECNRVCYELAEWIV